jgi:hypothetical protein
MRPSQQPQAERTRADGAGYRFALGARWGLVLASAFLMGQAHFAGADLAAQTTSGQTPAASQQTPAAKHRKKPASSHANLAAAQAPVSAVPASPPVPPPPDWPANDHPSDAKVTWDSKGLSIVAANSSLSQILKEVSTQTGATLQGFNQDERVFGVYGPGPARDVINQLLDGSGYNVLMIGDQGEGTPRQILLTPRTGGVSPPSGSNNQNPSPEETEAEQEAQQPEPPPPVRSGTAPAVPARSPQEIMQQLQQRQQQMQQQQQQQQNPQ